MRACLLVSAAAVSGLLAVTLAFGGKRMLPGDRHTSAAVVTCLICSSCVALSAAAVQSLGAKRPRVTPRLVRLYALSSLSYFLGALAGCLMPIDALRGVSPHMVLPGPGHALLISAVIYQIRKRLRKGYCVACDYDLTGNVSGRCPECGTPIAAEAVDQEARKTG